MVGDPGVGALIQPLPGTYGEACGSDRVPIDHYFFRGPDPAHASPLMLHDERDVGMTNRWQSWLPENSPGTVPPPRSLRSVARMFPIGRNPRRCSFRPRVCFSCSAACIAAHETGCDNGQKSMVARGSGFCPGQTGTSGQQTPGTPTAHDTAR